VTGRLSRFEWRGPVAVAATIGLLTVLSLWIDPVPYRWVFGRAEPAVVLAALVALGVPALVLLDRSGLFLFSARKTNRRGLVAALALAVMFAVLVVVVDVVVGFPATYNVPPPFPQSLLFYAVIGYVAEMAFHAIPLALIVALATRHAVADPHETTLRLGMVVVACLEPVFQARLGMPDNGAGIAWRELFVVMHVFAINLVQLGLFRQFGFVTTYAFRLLYYLLWHIAWGELRQIWLFGLA
jgi:hypothetical protein